MKKTVMYALTVAVLDVIAAYSVISSNIDPNAQAYNNAVAEAEKYESSELYYQSISCYNEALEIKDSFELRMKIADLYEKGYENGEISSLAGKYNMLSSTVQKYPQNTDSYDMIISYYESLGNWAVCADYVRLAHKNEADSDIIRECYDTIKTMYSETASGYSSVEDLGSCIQAEREVITEVNKTDENGEIIYTEDENGNTVPEKEQRKLTEYTFMFYDDTEPLTYTTVNMSPPAWVTYSDGKTHVLIFNKGYGNDIASGELSGRIYSRLESDGIRQCYIGEDNEYEAASYFNNRRIVLRNTKTQKYDMFGTSGKKLAEGYDMLGCFANNVAFSEKDGVKTVINTEGNSVFEKNIGDVILGHGGKCSYFNRMFVKFEGEESFKMINSEDMSEIGFECDDADLFFGEAAAFGKDGKYGFVNADGSVFMEPAYEDAKSFSNGYAAVMLNGKWGFINRFGDMVVEPAYEDALYMDSQGNAYVYLDESWRMITLFYTE